MREEEEPSWFARWEEQLPAPEELMPLSQSLITPDLAVAGFDHGFLTRAITSGGAPAVGPPGMHRMGAAAGMVMMAPSPFPDELELGSQGGGGGGGRRELTLFPTSGDR